MLAERLDRDGYVITPLFDAATVAELLHAHEQVAPGDDDGLTVDYMRPDRTVMRQVRDLLAPYWAQHLPEVFVDHVPV